MQNHGMCNTCQQMVPVHHEERDNQVYLVKECERCGRTETLISSMAERWRDKRALAEFDAQADGCDFQCRHCDHRVAPQTVFLDVTNRCDMACPICIANVSSMGFRFDPPLAYFEKIFDDLAKRTPVPSVKLFGGEPLVRKDLSDIIRMCQERHIPVAVVTNGIALANEERCRTLLEKTGARLIFSFDGFRQEIYDVLRNHPRALELKLKALDHVRKYAGAKITIMCVIGKGINDDQISRLFDFCHERRDFINALQFIPLTMTWEEGSIAADKGAITAMEDAEDIVAASAPGGKLEFVPAGLYPYPTFARFFKMSRSTFAGAHPNCESISYLISDGKRYVPLANYLKTSLADAIHDLVEADKKLATKVARIEKGVWRRLGLAGRRSRLAAYMAAWFYGRRHVHLGAVLGGHPVGKSLCLLGGLLIGRPLKQQLRKHLAVSSLLLVVILPFEEPRTLESERLVRCPASFAYEDPDTRAIRTMPACAWCLYKNTILRRISELYAGPAKSA